MTNSLFRRVALALLASLLLAPAASPVTKRVGQVTFVVEDQSAVPGGFFVARLQSRKGVGTAYAILDGRKAPAYSAARGPRALVPVPLETPAGEVTVGFEIFSRRGRQRIPLTSRISERPTRERRLEITPQWRALLASPDAARDERVLLGLLRTQSLTPPEPLHPPVQGLAGTGFSDRLVTTDGSPVAQKIDGTWGELHRGLDFAVPAGTPVRSPGRGTVLFAGPLVLAGQVVVVDHGQGLISVLMHLSRTDVAAGDTVAAGSPLGASGATGLVQTPLLEWRTYIHGIAVDPALVQRCLD